MKKLYILGLFLFSIALTSAQTTITQWNFNGTAADAIPGGASSPTTLSGTGTASLVGGVTATFASGAASGGSSDPVITNPENFGWNITTWAAQDTENKQRGIQFQVATTNYEGIILKFDQRLSNTAANTWVVQYSINGVSWTDAQVFTFEPAATGTGDVWYNQRTVDMSSITAINNQATVYFRIVAAFDPTTNNYRASRSTSTYGISSTSRFDMVTVQATTTLSNKNYDKSNLKMYPNPASEVVNFNENVAVKVYDLTGKKILEKENTSQINVNELSKGIYQVIINDLETKKLIIQ